MPLSTILPLSKVNWNSKSKKKTLDKQKKGETNGRHRSVVSCLTFGLQCQSVSIKIPTLKSLHSIVVVRV